MSERHTPGGTWCKPDCPAHRAEPRWPSGPDARYLDLDDPATVDRLAVAIHGSHPHGIQLGMTDADYDNWLAHNLIAALQEKRDPGE